MSKTVVLAEKPSVGRDIARVLKCQQKGNGYFEGEKYIVTWALGHLVTLADPEAYDNKYKSWSLEDLPMLPQPLKLVVIKQTGKQFQTVKSQLLRKDVADIVIATDAGREGELVARWILEKAHVNKPVKRLWISSVTDKAIQEGFQNLKPGKAYEHLYASAAARSAADWYVGINATRALTCKHNAQLSCGRVQTPTLAIIAQREEEIRQFKPRTYYGIRADAGSLKLIWRDQKSNQTQTFDKAAAEQVIRLIQGKDAVVKQIDKHYKKSYAPQLYDLTELQRDANKKFGYSAKETLSIMQSLYEQHKAVTYPRTDSRYLSSDIVSTLQDRLRACGIQMYAKYANAILKAGIKAGKSIVDDAKVTDHHAIIPTEQSPELRSLSLKERHIYDLVVRRFLSALYPPFEYEQTTIQAEIGKELFTARGKTVLSQGWKEVYDQAIEEEETEELADQVLPPIRQGEQLPVASLLLTSGETKPPARFTEAALLTAMENPIPYMSNRDQALIRTIGKTGGLGTVATRADIIDKLFHNFSIELDGKSIRLTAKGRQLLELVPDELKSPELTAAWELKLEQIAKGALPQQEFIREMMDFAGKSVREIKQSKQTFKHDNLTSTRCPDCGKPMLEVKGKRGRMLVCQDRECGHRKNLARTTNARCPQCRKKMELRGEGEGQLFVCLCGYREKLSVFEKRKKDNPKVSKREVSQYLRKQQQDEPINTALADALAKLKLDK
ncbi:DNA topoisomerase III [Xylanibacillus composti]|uniref:DNA topoisomerase 3 n=1 Tax=Xylanibacillus composti TaxID=1572762 RepID=A0A8J4M1F1_9BACL|nr:DNA topoisomerase III [Xylanibacillus composti]MDT9725679.1 DNA topoisomerase III [Xylanibacillus composti]GIQ67777.1 DNA topoisomerase 3 [Xylanibacillus composti]